jgi:hypothetical protein
MKKCFIAIGIFFISDKEFAEAIKPCVDNLNHPSTILSRTSEIALFTAHSWNISSVLDHLLSRFSIITPIRMQKASYVIGPLGDNSIKHGFQLAHIMPVGPGYDDRQRGATPVDGSMPLAAIFFPYL